MEPWVVNGGTWFWIALAAFAWYHRHDEPTWPQEERLLSIDATAPNLYRIVVVEEVEVPRGDYNRIAYRGLVFVASTADCRVALRTGPGALLKYQDGSRFLRDSEGSTCPVGELLKSADRDNVVPLREVPSPSTP